jgi:hypothetical protein
MIVRSEGPDELDSDVVVQWAWSRRYISLTLSKKLASRHPDLPSASPILNKVEYLNEKYVGVSIIGVFYEIQGKLSYTLCSTMHAL